MDNAQYLKTINQLLKFQFIIPSYQRGYRWTKRQVEDLLNDISEFIEKRNDNSQEVGDFYCLQPVIVKEVEKKVYKLIDGQQRLTTIFLILSYLRKRRYTITFEKRLKSQDFLENIPSGINKENIDFYYISKAYHEYIHEWFERKTEDEPTFEDEFYINLGKYTKVIWYEIGENEDEIEVFTRINSGKIPLTNAELIKALFLNSKNFTSNEKALRQIEIAKEWDEIEFALQKDEFWYFLTKKSYTTRIELIFELLATTPIKDEFSTYRYFAQKKEVIKLWSESEENVKKVFLSLKYWFDNRKIYHLVGYALSTSLFSLKELYNDFKDKTKSQFEKDLLTTIRKQINFEDLEKLNYHNKKDYNNILNTLLLFNIATLLNHSDSYLRFAFDKYNMEGWSLEHIHAQNDKGLHSHEDLKAWFENMKKYIKRASIKKKQERKQLIQEINEILDRPKIKKHDDNVQKLQQKIFAFFGESDINTIENLALLSGKVNSALSNNVFPVKRDILIEKDKKGAFIPIATKNVFLKYYSKDAQNLQFWDVKDRKNYVAAIKKVLKEF